MLRNFRLLLLIHILTFSETAKFVPYFAEPFGMESHIGLRPDIVTSYFYLQQINQSTVVVMGDMEVKAPIGPLMALVSVESWAGGVFKKTSSRNAIPSSSACDNGTLMDILECLTPKELFNKENCTFLPGKYEMYMNFNDVMHLRYAVYPQEPQLFSADFLQRADEILFGFALKIDVYRQDFYEYTQGRGEVP